MFAAYVALFRGVVGEKVIHLEWNESYQITMAGLAATRLFSAGGAGGILLSYWALRKAGMETRQAVCRMVAFLVVLYSVYLAASGDLRRPAQNPRALRRRAPVRHAHPSGPGWAGDRHRPADHPGAGRLRAQNRAAYIRAASARSPERLATVPATFAQGVRTALTFVRQPRSAAMAFGGAIGFWGANIAILWASFHAFDVSVPLGVVIQGFFLGMLANLIPFAPGGVGAVDAGMIGAFVPLRRAQCRGVRGGAHLPRDRLLAADSTGDRRLLPAAQDGQPLGGGGEGSARADQGAGA